MIDAKTARKKTETNRISLKRESIEKAISKAVEKGYDHIQLTTSLNEDIENELKENGYDVTRQAVGVKISW